MASKRSLTPKQARFAQEYLIDLNATQAAIRAGYSPKRADQSGYQLLSNIEIQAAIEKGQAKIAEKNDISIKWVLDNLKTVADRCVGGKDSAGANRSLELIGKHLGMFIDRTQEIDPAVPIAITIQEIDASLPTGK